MYTVRRYDCTQKQPKTDEFDISFLTCHVCLQRIWSLGPKRTGPNFLLSSNSTSASLFAGVDSAVVRLSAKQEKKSASHPAQADLGGPGGPQVDDPALRPSELAEADTHSELSARVWSTSCSEYLHGHSATTPQSTVQLPCPAHVCTDVQSCVA